MALEKEAKLAALSWPSGMDFAEQAGWLPSLSSPCEGSGAGQEADYKGGWPQIYMCKLAKLLLPWGCCHLSLCSSSSGAAAVQTGVLARQLSLPDSSLNLAHLSTSISGSSTAQACCSALQQA